MKEGWGMVVLLLVTFGVALHKANENNNRHVSSYAGEVCDKTWARTRPGTPTVGWFKQCINTVADINGRVANDEK